MQRSSPLSQWAGPTVRLSCLPITTTSPGFQCGSLERPTGCCDTRVCQTAATGDNASLRRHRAQESARRRLLRLVHGPGPCRRGAQPPPQGRRPVAPTVALLTRLGVDVDHERAASEPGCCKTSWLGSSSSLMTSVVVARSFTPNPPPRAPSTFTSSCPSSHPAPPTISTSSCS